MRSCEDHLLLLSLLRYSLNNCLFEAALEMVVSKCNCLPGFHLVDGGYEECFGEKRKCMTEILDRIGETQDTLDT